MKCVNDSHHLVSFKCAQWTITSDSVSSKKEKREEEEEDCFKWIRLVTGWFAFLNIILYSAHTDYHQFFEKFHRNTLAHIFFFKMYFFLFPIAFA